MWSNRKSLKVVVPRLLRSRPPYCPNPDCRWHNPELAKEEGVFYGHGSRPINRFPYLSPRFLCTRCSKAFTFSFFSLTYRDRQPNTYEEILDMRVHCASKAHIARFLGLSRSTLEQRISKLARWSLLRMAKDGEGLKIRESIAFDGLENFSFSQYDPNNLNHAVGRESLYFYDVNFSPLNRKGVMSPRQKKRLREIEQVHGRYPGNALETSSLRLFSRLLKRSEADLELHTDNHYAYRRALRKLKSHKLSHRITPARVGRNYRNRLFAINHMDLLSRHHMADFKRETIAFAKTSISMIESFFLLAAYKNYLRPCFVKKQKENPMSNKESPAMRVGIANRILSFQELFKTRITKHQVTLNPDWQLFFERKDPLSRRVIRPYLGM